MADSTEVIFFSENITAITVKFTRLIHASVAIVRLFFNKVLVIFNTLLPTLNKALYTSVVKFPESTSVRITKTLFQLFVTCKMAS
jgi:hypothetical protein